MYKKGVPLAGIRKRGKSYQIRISRGYDNNGKQIIRSMTWRPNPDLTEKQVQKELNRQAVMFEEKVLGNTSRRIKFEAFSKQWYKEYAELNHKETTLQRDRQLSKRVNKALGYIWLDKITSHDIQIFINSLAEDGANINNGKPLSYKTIKHHLSYISSILGYAYKQEMINYNPCSRVSIPKVSQQRKERKIYTKDEVKRFIHLLSKAPITFRAFFTLLIFTGCRRGELLGLEWNDFDFEKKTIHICRTSNYTMKRGMYTDTPKTEKSNRVITIPSEVIDLIIKYKNEKEEYAKSLGDKWNCTERLFTTWNGRPMYSNTPYTWLKRECKKWGFPFYGLHTFRHLFASISIEAGIDPITVAAMLGHSTPQTTLSTYSHYFQETKIRASNVVADILLGKTET